MNEPEPFLPDPDPPVQDPGNPVEEPPSLDDIDHYEVAATASA